MKKLNNLGVTHLLLAMVLVVGLASVGTFMLIKSHADSCSARAVSGPTSGPVSRPVSRPVSSAASGPVSGQVGCPVSTPTSGPVSSPVITPVIVTDRLRINQKLIVGGSLVSVNKNYRFSLQTSDGNLVIQNAKGKPIWSANVQNKGGTALYIQRDGNLVLRNNALKTVWATNTQKSKSSYLVMKNDGNLVLYDTTGHAKWTSRSGRIN